MFRFGFSVLRYSKSGLLVELKLDVKSWSAIVVAVDSCIEDSLRRLARDFGPPLRMQAPAPSPASRRALQSRVGTDALVELHAGHPRQLGPRDPGSEPGEFPEPGCELFLTGANGADAPA
jgi:hypothetical protein